MKTIGIVGYGYVGKAFAEMVRGQYEVWVYDPSFTLPNGDACTPPPLENLIYSMSKEIINTCDLAVICVPTPSLPDGGCDTSIVEEVVGWLDPDGPRILIKSTITPGTTYRLKSKYGQEIVFSPEYVGEGKYAVTERMAFQTDMKKTPFLILGGSDDDCNYILDLLVPILGPEKTYYKCSALEAEVIKYMENTYFGVKITFAQEMYDICQALGADWYNVWQGWALDPRVDAMHTAVFPENRGFSGKCLPKDMNALVKASVDAGYTPQFLLAALRKNAELRTDEPVRVKAVNETV